jgi:hypothetical protein
VQALEWPDVDYAQFTDQPPQIMAGLPRKKAELVF